MTQEEKQLLIIDLCARLPYGVKCNALLKQIDGSLKNIFGTFKGYNGWATVGNDLVDIETVRPYLRPMSSMTREEEEEYNSLLYGICDFTQDTSRLTPIIELTTFLDSHLFDYKGLIEKGLAFEAIDMMYSKITRDNCNDND